MKLLAPIIIGVFAPTAGAQCLYSAPPPPVSNTPYVYVFDQDANLDQYLCQDFHLATVTLAPSPGGALVSATLTMSAYDVDPGEDNYIIVDNTHVAGQMHKGGNNCWSVTTLDVTSLITLGGTHEAHIDMDTAG